MRLRTANDFIDLIYESAALFSVVLIKDCPASDVYSRTVQSDDLVPSQLVCGHNLVVAFGGPLEEEQILPPIRRRPLPRYSVADDLPGRVSDPTSEPFRHNRIAGSDRQAVAGLDPRLQKHVDFALEGFGRLRKEISSTMVKAVERERG